MSNQQSAISKQQTPGRVRCTSRWLLAAGCWLLAAGITEAAVSKGTDKQLASGSTNQGGATVISSNYRQQATIGSAVASVVMSTSRFRAMPGILAAEPISSKSAVSQTNLDITTLYAKTDPLGESIAAQTWQKDRDPIFIWEAPKNAINVAGYSYAMDAAPDDTVDTTGTSYNVAAATPAQLADGRHTFSVKALGLNGTSGNVRSFDLWVDTTPPQILNYSPTPGGLLGTRNLAVNATVSDADSGVTASKLTLFVNGNSVPISFDPVAGTLKTTSTTAFKEGKNSLELRVADVVGNAQTPLLWSVTLDTIPPTGSVVINGGSTMTTSVYVTLGVSAADATSGVTKMLISNDPVTGYVEESYAALRELWRLLSVRGMQTVYVKFMDAAGNISAPVSDQIELVLLAPETVITSGPAGILPDRTADFTFMCPEGGCVFSYAFDNQPWSAWSATATATIADLPFGNHYFRVKAAKEVNSTAGIQPDEEDPTPAERTWIVGVEPTTLPVPKGPPIKLWRIE